MMLNRWIVAAALLGAQGIAANALANFDWGSDCSNGEGTFTQDVPQGETALVGVIPVGKQDVEVLLFADMDVDVQLVDVATGTELIAWPSGLLNGPGEACGEFEGTSFCYSGYNGTMGELGREWIRVNGATNRALEMRVYGYQAGEAQVNYRWSATPTCNEVGSGAFSQYVPYRVSTEVGTIPVGKVNVAIELDAALGRDVDVRLYDGDVEIVAWPDGLLSGATEGSVAYRGMEITYSGYNGIDGDWGHERIVITGRVPTELRMEAFGYQAGDASVIYSWGEGVGELCGGIAGFVCEDGLVCKGVSPLIADDAGECHTAGWCNEDPMNECANLFHPAVPGTWVCESYTCNWQMAGPPRDACGMVIADTDYVSEDVEQCAVIRYTCDAGQEPFSNDCGCGCTGGLIY